MRVTRSGGEGRPRRAARRDARDVGDARRRAGGSSAFTRAMDNIGAVVGPALATLFLFFYPGAVPDAVRADDHSRRHRRHADLSAAGRGRECPASAATPADPDGRAYQAPNVRLPRSFTAVHAGSRAVRARQLNRRVPAAAADRRGRQASPYVPLMWAGLHVVKAIVSMVGGSWSDRVGRRTVIAIGWLVYAVVYAGFARQHLAHGPSWMVHALRLLLRIRGGDREGARRGSAPLSIAAASRLASTTPSPASARSRRASCSVPCGPRTGQRRRSASAQRSRSWPPCCFSPSYNC